MSQAFSSSSVSSRVLCRLLHCSLDWSPETNLRSLVRSEVEQTLRDSQRQLDHEINLQDKIETLLADNPADLRAEQEEADRFESVRHKLATDANLALLTCDVHTKCQFLLHSLDDLLATTVVTTKIHQDSVGEFNKEFKDLYHLATPLFTDDRLAAAFTKLKQGKVQLKEVLAKCF